MRWLRLLLAIMAARFRSRIGIHETSTKTFRVWLTDVDASIMNHAAMMTVFEAGRIDLMVRTGFFRVARKKKWFFPSTAIRVQFFRPLKLFQEAVLFTRIMHVGEQNIYTEQKIVMGGKDIACCLVKSKVKSGKENIPTAEIISLLKATEIPVESGDLISQWEQQDEAFREQLFRQT